jgi:hypothetical protein
MDSFATLSLIVKYASELYATEANRPLITESSKEEVEQEMADFERRGGGGNCYCVIG